MLYAIHFFPGGGHNHLINDSRAYIEISQGQPVGIPFNTRILQPLLASSISGLTAIESITAFQLLTAAELLLSLLLIASLLRRRNATGYWEAAVVLTLGCSLAATFGYVPVMADPLLLLLACLTIELLDRDRLILALGCCCLAALTKEYGVILGLCWLCHAYRKRRGVIAWAGASLPFIALLIALFVMPSAAIARTGFSGWRAFVGAMFGYHISLFNFRGPLQYIQIIFMWAWSIVWPVMLLSISLVVSRLRSHISLGPDLSSFAAALCVMPVLLLGDWGRSMLVVVPLALAASATHPLTKDNRFALLLAVGGIATALARPFHGDVIPPFLFIIAAQIISAIASAAIALRIGKFFLTGATDPAADSATIARGVGTSATNGLL